MMMTPGGIPLHEGCCVWEVVIVAIALERVKTDGLQQWSLSTLILHAVCTPLIGGIAHGQHFSASHRRFCAPLTVAWPPF